MTELLLGWIKFRQFEIPDGINFGGRQRLSIHRLGNGGRVVDLLGADDADISFCGTFSGSDATTRARMIDQWRIAGAVLPLTWDGFFYSVTLRSFTADYRNRSWIPYSVDCTIISDAAQQAWLDPLDLPTSLANDMEAAIATATPVGFDLSELGTAVAMPQAILPRSSANQVAIAAVRRADQSATSTLGAAEANLLNAPLSGVQGGPLAAQLDQAVNSTRTLGMLTTAQGYIRRVGMSLAEVGS